MHDLYFLILNFNHLNSFLFFVFFIHFRKSNLAEIFEADESGNPNEMNPTLKYIPPKSKQPHAQKTTENPTWNVIIAKIVGAFRLYVFNHFEVYASICTT